MSDRQMDGECEPFPLSRRERSFLIDALMVLMHQREQVPENDLSEQPEMQALLERLMAPANGG
jgi:hypothetical protein